VQLENVTAPHYLDGFKVLLLTYQGMKPLSPDVHSQLAEWMKQGGVLVFCDDDSDPFNAVREWWNSGSFSYRTPREHLFDQVGFNKNVARSYDKDRSTEWRFGKGEVIWAQENPVQFARESDGADRLVSLAHRAAGRAKLKWRDTNYLLLRRGPYIIAAGLDESIPGATEVLTGHFIDLFDPELRVQTTIRIEPNSRFLLRDLDAKSGREPEVLESACKSLTVRKESKSISMAVEGVGDTPAVVLLKSAKPPRSVTLENGPVKDFNYSAKDNLLWIRFMNESRPRTLSVQF
jgi:hypothetical protein